MIRDWMNYGEQHWLKVDHKNWPAGTIVYTLESKGVNDKKQIKVKDKFGNENICNCKDLGWFLISKTGGYVYSLLKEISKDEFLSLPHISEHVCEVPQTVRLMSDVLFFNDPSDYIKVHQYSNNKNLTEKEIVDILLNEVLYDTQPNLQAVSCVGWDPNRGLDKDPNYRDGNYRLENGKDYTMTWCRGKIKIREGIDGGWYSGGCEIGKTLYEGEIDWNRWRQAYLKKQAIRHLTRFAEHYVNNIPSIQEIMERFLKDSDETYKLSSEIEK